jgi:predicted transcriptional regulator
MSATMSAALRCPGLSTAERVIFASLWERADTDGQCSPTIETLALDHEMSRRAVIKAIEALATRDLIRVQRRSSNGCIYHLRPMEDVL